MKVTNKKGKDVTTLYIQLLEGKITKEEFKKLAEVKK